jgi:hypothetical protein
MEFKVEGKDREGNTFTTLGELEFDWQTENNTVDVNNLEGNVRCSGGTYCVISVSYSCWVDVSGSGWCLLSPMTPHRTQAIISYHPRHPTTHAHHARI